MRTVHLALALRLHLHPDAMRWRARVSLLEPREERRAQILDDGEVGDGGGEPAPSAKVGIDMVKVLVERGANLEAKDVEGYTALHWACRKGRVEAAHCLLELGADLYAQNKYGSTALHLAVMHNHLDVVQLLARRDCEFGLLKRTRDCRNKRPCDYCSSSASREALNTLFECAAAGMLDRTQQLLRATQEVAPIAAPWQPAFIWEATHVLERSALHCVMSGAAAACDALYV